VGASGQQVLPLVVQQGGTLEPQPGQSAAGRPAAARGPVALRALLQVVPQDALSVQVLALLVRLVQLRTLAQQ